MPPQTAAAPWDVLPDAPAAKSPWDALPDAPAAPAPKGFDEQHPYLARAEDFLDARINRPVRAAAQSVNQSLADIPKVFTAPVEPSERETVFGSGDVSSNPDVQDASVLARRAARLGKDAFGVVAAPFSVATAPVSKEMGQAVDAIAPKTGNADADELYRNLTGLVEMAPLGLETGESYRPLTPEQVHATLSRAHAAAPVDVETAEKFENVGRTPIATQPRLPAAGETTPTTIQPRQGYPGGEIPRTTPIPGPQPGDLDRYRTDVPGGNRTQQERAAAPPGPQPNQIPPLPGIPPTAYRPSPGNAALPPVESNIRAIPYTGAGAPEPTSMYDIYGPPRVAPEENPPLAKPGTPGPPSPAGAVPHDPSARSEHIDEPTVAMRRDELIGGKPPVIAVDGAGTVRKGNHTTAAADDLGVPVQPAVLTEPDTGKPLTPAEGAAFSVKEHLAPEKGIAVNPEKMGDRPYTGDASLPQGAVTDQQRADIRSKADEKGGQAGPAPQPTFGSRNRAETAAAPPSAPQDQAQALRTENLRLETALRERKFLPPDERAAATARIQQNTKMIEEMEAPHTAPVAPAQEAPRAAVPPAPPTASSFAPAAVDTSRVPPGANDPIGWIQNEAARTADAREIDSGLTSLGAKDAADAVRAKQAIAAVKIGSGDDAAVYHASEDPKLASTLTPSQVALKTQFKPLEDASRAIVQKLQKAGIDAQEYVHRMALGKGTKLEKLLLGENKSMAGGSVLSKFSPALKRRSMMAIEDEDGNRMVVSVKGRAVTGWDKGSPRPLGTVGQLEDAGWRLGQATTKEIESNTSTKYFHSYVGSTVLNYLNLRHAERAFDYIEHLKTSPQWSEIAHKMDAGSSPPGWKQVAHPQLKGYAFEPHTAEVLDRYWDRLTKGEDTFDKIGKVLRTSIFYNPLFHIPNIGWQWIGEKGLSGWSDPRLAPARFRSFTKAINAVVHENADYIKALDEGAPLATGADQNKAVRQMFVDKMTHDFQNNQLLATKVARALGITPTRLITAWYDMAGKATWAADDIMRLQATYERMERNNVDFKTAIKDVSKIIPDYHIPTRIANSRMLGRVMENPSVTMFGGYHYGLLNSFGQMARDAVSKESDPATRAKAFDRLAMTGVLTYVLLPQLDKLAQAATGDKNASMRRFGSSAVIEAVQGMIKGTRSASSAIEAIATPAVHTKAAIAVTSGFDPVSGQRIRDTKKPAKVQLQQTADYLKKQLGPVAAIEQKRTGKKGPVDWKKLAQSMIGVRFGRAPQGAPGSPVYSPPTTP